MTGYLDYKNDLNDSALVSFFDDLSFWSSRFGALLFRNIAFGRGLQILDLACGTGFPSFELANVFGPSSHVTAIDVWRAGLDRAAAKQRFHNLANLTFIEADGARQPFDDSTFDMIVSNLGLNNFADPAAVLAECFRVARGGASLYMTTNINGHFAEFYDVFRRVLAETNKPDQMERLDANETHRGTKESIAGLLQDAGFKLIRLVEDSFEMRFLDGTALFNHALTKIGFLDGWKSVVGADDERETFEKLEEALNREAALKGELRMTVPMLLVEAKKPGGD